jgi:hypothetical protein
MVTGVGNMKRDQAWLQQMLDKIWDNYFTDVPQVNDVRITFGRRAKRRLGSISLDPANANSSVIVINSVFKDTTIPEFVIEATVVHELTHYAHGFNSPLEQVQRHPHAGGVMRREFAERGLLELYLQQKRWLKANWPGVVEREFGASIPRRTVPTEVKVPKPFWLG